jgi:hypothetical protein
MSVCLDFFGFIAFLGVSQRWEFKNTTNNVLQTNRFDFFLGFVLSRFWAFPGEGVQVQESH